MFGRSLALFGLSTLLAAAVPAVLHGPARVGAAAGVITAALATALALGVLQFTARRDIKQLLVGLVLGFLIRMALVAAGLLIARALGGDLLVFAAAFFGLYLAHQFLEIAVVAKRARTHHMEGKA